MSAFVVPESHIHALLTWAIDNRVDFYDEKRGTRIAITEEHASMVGTILLQTNDLSVSHLYKEAPANVNYEFVRFPRRLEPVQVLKGIDCLDYQSCELDDWKLTMAYTICQAIQTKAIQALAGYSAAPWVISMDAFNRKRSA